MFGEDAAALAVAEPVDTTVIHAAPSFENGWLSSHQTGATDLRRSPRPNSLCFPNHNYPYCFLIEASFALL